jgi:hypothetical protein
MHGDAEHVPIGGLGTGARVLFEAIRDAAR